MARHDQRVGYGLPTLLAVGLHVLVVVLSLVTLPGSSETEPASTSIVQATLVSTETVTDQAQRAEAARSQALARQADEQRQAEEAAREAEQAAAAVEAEREAQRQAEAQAREEARQAAEEEAARRAEEAERQAQQREAEEQRRQEEEAERQRQAEEEARRQREAEEQRRREEEAAERQRQEEAARAAEAASQGLDRAIEGESDAVADARQGQEAANSFINLVRRAVEQAWMVPPNVPGGATAEVAVRLGPSGELFNASISRSSGDSAFDRSAIQAVEAAAPFAELRQLPANLQRDYRQFNLRFTPGDVR